MISKASDRLDGHIVDGVCSMGRRAVKF
jgi:hypothetical protein